MKQKQIVPLLLIALILASCNLPKQQNKKANTLNPEDETTEQILTNGKIEQLLANEEKIHIGSVGILVYEGFFDLDAFGPFSVLSGMVGTDVFFVAEKQGRVKTSSGIEIMVSKSIDEVNHLDILLIPGGTTGTVNASKNEKLLQWIRKIDETSIFTTSVCTGAWILGEAGLLNNKKATTNWYRAKEKIESYNAEFIPERYVRDGKLWTSAGVSAGIDMSLALVKEIKGENYTKLIMLNLEYNPEPPIKGGSVNNTNQGLVNYMTNMYDAILKAE